MKIFRNISILSIVSILLLAIIVIFNNNRLSEREKFQVFLTQE